MTILIELLLAALGLTSPVTNGVDDPIIVKGSGGGR
jgi:hypothetical protein